jgi:hypothetical protein
MDTKNSSGTNFRAGPDGARRKDAPSNQHECVIAFGLSELRCEAVAEPGRDFSTDEHR